MASVIDLVLASLDKTLGTVFENRPEIDVADVRQDFMRQAITSPEIIEKFTSYGIQMQNPAAARLSKAQEQEVLKTFEARLPAFIQGYQPQTGIALREQQPEEARVRSAFLELVSNESTGNDLGIPDFVFERMSEEEKQMRRMVLQHEAGEIHLSPRMLKQVRDEIENRATIKNLTGQSEVATEMRPPSKETTREALQEGSGLQPYQREYDEEDKREAIREAVQQVDPAFRQQRIAELLFEGRYSSAFEGWEQPEYSVSRGSGLPEHIKFRRSDGKTQLLRPEGRGYQFARLFDESLTKDIEALLKEMLLRHYREKGIHVESGALLRSIANGKLTPDEQENVVTWTFTPTNEKRDPRPGEGSQHGGHRKQTADKGDMSAAAFWPVPPTTDFYGPLVFQGRKPIVSINPMKFRAGGKLFSVHHVKEAPARDIYEMKPEEMGALAAIIASGFAASMIKVLAEGGYV